MLFQDTKSFSIALFQPDIAGNTGAILRLCACQGINLHIIEPTGFDISDRNLRRAGMDYIELASLTRHSHWLAFYEYALQNNRRIILFTTKSSKSYYDFSFRDGDILLFGRESSGVPNEVHDAAFDRLTIPMMPKTRSLNLALSVAMAAAIARYPQKTTGD